MGQMVPRPARSGAQGVEGGGMRTAILAITCTALLVVGCGEDSRTATQTTATATATATPTPSATPAGVDPLDGASTDPVEVPASNADTALLTDVRAARHEGYDRVVFEFAGEPPGYAVRYVDPPLHEDGSGDVVRLAGEHFVEVRMENALDADLSKPGAPQTYEGPTRITPSTPVVAELVRTGGFEGVLTWAVGLRDRVDFRVRALQDPSRLVIDFRNH
jgi:hypothetical protein